MNEFVKQSINGRKDIFTSNYQINNQNIKDKIDNLFVRIEDFGKNFNDPMEFEKQFMESNLNKEYNDLLTEVAMSCKFIVKDENQFVDSNDLKKEIKDEVVSDAKYILEDLSMPARRKAREELDSRLRDTPLGTLEQISNMKSLFNKLKKNK